MVGFEFIAVWLVFLLMLITVREMERLKEKLRTTSDDDNIQLMTIYEKLGDAAAKVECYQVALDYYLNLVSTIYCLDLHQRHFLLLNCDCV